MKTHGQVPSKTYANEWKAVENALQKGLPATAHEEVRKIYNLAKKEKQQAELIKAVVYMINLQDDTRENNEVLSAQELKKEISEHSGAAKAVLQSLLARFYTSYFEQVRWQLYERTTVQAAKSDDMTTWNAADFHQEITGLLLHAIQDEKLLKATKLKDFDAIITKGNTRNLRPTLFDLLVHQALRYFSQDEVPTIRPAYAFEITQAAAFDPAADFVHRKFETQDTTSNEYLALLLYQKLIAFHLNDPQPDALIDADLLRLQYVKQKSVHPQADELYFQAVNHVAHQYESTPAAAEAWYLAAAWYDQQASTYRPLEDTTTRFFRIKAEEICEKTVAANPASEGGIHAANLLLTIRQKSLRFTTENVTIPGKPFLALATYRNVSNLYIRILPATPALKAKIDYHTDAKFWAQARQTRPLQSWVQSLPDTKDRQEHRVEIKMAALPVGEYIILLSTTVDFIERNNVLAARSLYVSNLSYAIKGDDYFVLHRETGQPVVDAVVKVFNVHDNYGPSIPKKTDLRTYKTDKNGHFRRPNQLKVERVTNEVLAITAGNDSLAMNQHIITYYLDPAEPEKPAVQTFVFTDRSIYRPGQTVYYKGIVASGKNVLANSKTDFYVILFNANGEKTDSAAHKTNAYGSFSGKFQLPRNMLNGTFRIAASSGGQSDFRVEEYKRPKFEVTFDTLKNPYQVHDMVRATGRVLAYAGNAIGSAKVTYRVSRTPRFIYPWLAKRWWMPASSTMEITHGETVTDTAGEFTITFEAIPDLKIDKKLDPAFDFTIYADITDSNGETRSGEMQVSVGYKSIVIKASIPGQLPADSLRKLDVHAENMNGAHVAADVKVTVSILRAELRLLRSRYWERPDVFVMPKEEFITAFPNDPYHDETMPESWPVNKMVFEGTRRMTGQEAFPLPGRFEPGYYKIEISTTDPNGEEIKDIRYIELTDPAGPGPLRPQYLWVAGTKPIEPGESTSIRIASSAPDVFVIRNVPRKSGAFTYESLGSSPGTFHFNATEADRGGYWVEFMFVKNNRIYHHREQIEVPWTNKELRVEYLSFRDKTLPGSREKWTVRISGSKKESIAAEMLAGMYDASLDQFYAEPWQKPAIWSMRNEVTAWNTARNFFADQAIGRTVSEGTYRVFEKSYDEIDGFFTRSRRYRNRSVFKKGMTVEMPMEAQFSGGGMEEIKEAVVADQVKYDREAQELATDSIILPEEKPLQRGGSSLRTHLNETAFFFPDLQTGKNGDITFSFDMPEALTRWKFQALAHTAELAFSYSSRDIVTQKDLMVQPNPPRFLREKDHFVFPMKIVNLTDRPLSGMAALELADTDTGENISALLQADREKPFSIEAKESTTVLFAMQVPDHFTKTITWRTIAKAGDLADGEENTLPVLSNRMLVTESLPLDTDGSENKTYRFEKLLTSRASSTLANHALTVEFSSNPGWYAVQALPYLMEYPYECAEQTWNRYYANALASHVIAGSPRIAKVFESWKTTDTAALVSNLLKNEELKSVILEETPWVLAAKSETEQKKNIALLFDLTSMSEELSANARKLAEMQSASGGFAWFKGGPNDRYITQYILSGMGHLRKLAGSDRVHSESLNSIVGPALQFLDAQLRMDYDVLLKDKTNLEKYVPGPVQLQYLYMRGFFSTDPIPDKSEKAYRFFLQRAAKTWLSQSKYLQGLTALALHRSGDNQTPKAILKSLAESAVRNAETGMYWKDNQYGWRWHEAPIERQALLAEAFQEINGDPQTVDALKRWLLKNKQTNRWESTRATAEACYVLLMSGSNWVAADQQVSIKMGDVSVAADQESPEAGTGYFSKTIPGKDVKPELGNITVNTAGSNAGNPGWGAVYWQYFEDLDKITFAETPLKLAKKLFIEQNSDQGPVLVPVDEGHALHIGNKVIVRIELRADRDMEYVHMKDMRASSLEPVNVLSGYKWQDGLGYYESTKDASTNFFFSSLRKGTYVFEYPLFVAHEGEFSNGITTIQCMYAPEFTAHSEGVRVTVDR
ncbi:alpha-2-macroglobulin family protein [Dyadobacter sandarakinus]|nr:MG2 domain-containing protein [Dyadobacter sandarakinus]